MVKISWVSLKICLSWTKKSVWVRCLKSKKITEFSAVEEPKIPIHSPMSLSVTVHFCLLGQNFGREKNQTEIWVIGQTWWDRFRRCCRGTFLLKDGNGRGRNHVPILLATRNVVARGGRACGERKQKCFHWLLLVFHVWNYAYYIPTWRCLGDIRILVTVLVGLKFSLVDMLCA